VSFLSGKNGVFRVRTCRKPLPNTEQLDLENMGVAVEILSIGILELEITLGGILPPPLAQCVCKNTLAV